MNSAANPQPPPIAPHPLNYSASSSATRPIGPAVWLSCWIAFDATIVAILMFISSRGEQVLKDFKMPVPLVTRFWLSLSRWFREDFGWVLFMLLVAGAITTLLMLRPTLTTADGRRWPRAMARMVLTLLFAIPVVIAIFAAVMPYISLINSLSGQGTK